MIHPAELPKRKAHKFSYTPDVDEIEEMVAALPVIGLSKVRLEGSLHPSGSDGWDLNAQLGATATQSCVVTLDPVRTRIDEPLQVHYRTDLEDEGEVGELEMPEDENLELMPGAIDLLQLSVEALSLALPTYPRADGAHLEDAVFTEPGKTPMRDEDAKPFAGLAGLKDQLDRDDPT